MPCRKTSFNRNRTILSRGLKAETTKPRFQTGTFTPAYPVWLSGLTRPEETDKGGIMKIAVTGASGLLGRAVLGELGRTARDHEILGLAFSRLHDALVPLDLTDPSAVNTFLEAKKPEILLHLAAERRPDISEGDHDATTALNVTATRQLAKWSGATGARMVYISTDYVFDGTAPPYHPESPTNPLNFYGKSKLAGELETLNNAPNSIILRVPILYGHVEYMAESAVTALIDPVRENREMLVDHWATRYPVLVDDVAYVLGRMVERIADGDSVSGIYQFSGDEPMTKYDMATVIAEIMGISPLRIKPNTSSPEGAPRPKDTRMDNSAIEAICRVRRTAFRDAIVSILRD